MALERMHLRLEAANGAEGKEYRICDGQIEVRGLECSSKDDWCWHRVTPEELTAHVNAGTVVAEWLKRRLGWRRLLRACMAEQDLYLFEAADRSPDHRAA
jgi:hypothetical protein